VNGEHKITSSHRQRAALINQSAELTDGTTYGRDRAIWERTVAVDRNARPAAIRVTHDVVAAGYLYGLRAVLSYRLYH
jgi:hypothetical protein